MIYEYSLEPNGVKFEQLPKLKHGLKSRGILFSDTGLSAVATQCQMREAESLNYLNKLGYSSVEAGLYSLEDYIKDIIGPQLMHAYFKSPWYVQKTYSMSTENFESYIQDHPNTEESVILAYINQLRKARYFMSTSATWRRLKEKSADGWCIPEVSSAVTGRILTKKPCLENIPKEFRYPLFTLQEQGYSIVEIDFKQEEPRLLISKLGSQNLISNTDPYQNMYLNIASKVFGISGFATQDIKDLFKQAWNAVSYGMKVGSLVNLFKAYGLDGRRYHEYFYNLPEYTNWVDACRTRAQEVVDNREPKFYIRNVLNNKLLIDAAYKLGVDKVEKLIRSYEVQSAGVGVLELALRGVEAVREKYGVVDGDYIDDGIFAYFTLHDAVYVAIDNQRFGPVLNNIIQDLNLVVQIYDPINQYHWVPLVTEQKVF